MNTIVGLTVTLRDSFTPVATAIQNRVTALQTRFTSFKDSVTSAWTAFRNEHGTEIRNSLYKTGAMLLAVGYNINKVTEYWVAQDQAMRNLAQSTARWGISYQQAVDAAMRSGVGSTAERLQSMAGMIRSGFAPAQAEILAKGLRDLLANAAPAGKVNETVNATMQAIAHGSAGAITDAIPMFNARMAMMHTSMGDLLDPRKRAIAMAAMMSILNSEFRATAGNYLEYTRTLGGATENFRAQLHNTWATIGEVLAPAIVKFTNAVTALLARLQDFVKQHPGLARFVTAFVLFLALVPLVSALTHAIEGLALIVTTLLGLNPVIGFLAISAALIGIFAAWKAHANTGQSIMDWFKHLWLVANGVWELFTTFNGTTSTMSLNTYNALKNAGLLEFTENLTLKLERLWNEAKAFFEGLLYVMLPVGEAIFTMAVGFFDFIGSLLGSKTTLGGVNKDLDAFYNRGMALGKMLTVVLIGALLATAVAFGTAAVNAALFVGQIVLIVGVVLLAVDGIMLLVAGLLKLLQGIAWATTFVMTWMGRGFTHPGEAAKDASYLTDKIGFAKGAGWLADSNHRPAMMLYDLLAGTRSDGGSSGPSQLDLSDNTINKLGAVIHKTPIQINNNIDSQGLVNQMLFTQANDDIGRGAQTTNVFGAR